MLVVPCCSGNTADQPGLLQYSCRLTTNIRPSKAAKVESTAAEDSSHLEAVSHILGGKPILALCFDDMEVCQ